MRSIYDPITGGDVTSTVHSLLRNSKTFVTFTLFRFQCMIFWDYNPYGNLGDFVFTDAPFPIFVQKYQVGANASSVTDLGYYHNGTLTPAGAIFLSDTMECQQLEYDIGFKDHPVQITWPIDDSVAYGVWVGSFVGEHETFLNGATSPVNLTLKRALMLGAFREAPFWIHSAIFSDFPSNGGSFLGTTLMHRGVIRKATANRSNIKLEIASLMDVFQQTQIPTQTLTPNNRALPYIPVAASPYGGDFGFVSATNEQTILFSTAETIAQDALRDSWMMFQTTPASGTGYFTGRVSAPGWKIAGNEASTGSQVTVYFAAPPVIGGFPVLINVFTQLGTSGGAVGFPYIPPPEFSA